MGSKIEQQKNKIIQLHTHDRLGQNTIDELIFASRMLSFWGGTSTYTCAHYLLNNAHKRGGNIGWAESNTVIFANSALSTHTQKHLDFLDACIKLTGLVPKADCHLDNGYLSTLLIEVEKTTNINDAFYPLLGYAIGNVVSHQISLIYGLKEYQPTRDNSKALSAAFTTTTDTPMFHISGVTPKAELSSQWEKTSTKSIVLKVEGLIKKWQSLADLIKGKAKNPMIDFMITIGRDVFAKIEKNETYHVLKSFKVNFINDTCWCMIIKPIFDKKNQKIIINAREYTHYRDGLASCQMRFGYFSDCGVNVVSRKKSKKYLFGQVISNFRGEYV